MPTVNEIARAAIVTNAVNKAANAYLNKLRRENARLTELAKMIRAANTLRGMKRKR